jgi:carbon-monoxide dehydrogenase large subunit
MWVPSQAPFFVQGDTAEALGVDEALVQVVAPAVGGGFGAKGDTYPEQIAMAALAIRLARPIRYVETRSENLLAMVHGRAQVQEVELAARRDGTVVGLRAHVVADMGAYPFSTYLPDLTRLMSSGVYRIPRIDFRWDAVVTNTTPIGAYRGAGRPEATAMLERCMDLLATELGMDPAEVRRRNLIPRDAFPYRTASGATYDVGDYELALDEALRLAGYESLRKEQAERRARGDRMLLGIGVSTYVEVTGWGAEFGSVEVVEDGSVTVLTGVSPHGQGHETSLAQIASGLLGVPMGQVRVVHSDTRLLPSGRGTMGSRSLQKGGSAVYRAGEAVVEKARRIAAHVLEAALEDVVLSDEGRIGVAGAPDRALTWGEIAAAAGDAARLPAGMGPGLVGRFDFDNEGNTFPFGAHVSVVEVDSETGLVRPIRHVAVDDCGRILNPMLVDGQVHGGVTQGLAQALYEEVTFDQEGNPLTSSLMVYEMPSAPEIPPIETFHPETPTPLNPLGVKGIGESGSVGSTPAVQSAVIDALSHLGVRHVDMPLTPEKVWRAIRDSRP